MIQMIVMDMDGTLLTSDNRISSRTKELLLRVQKQGVRLVLASGRSYCKLMEYAEELHMDAYGGYLLEVNGLILYDRVENVISASRWDAVKWKSFLHISGNGMLKLWHSLMTDCLIIIRKVS